jgi:hypothetical protein
MKTTADKPNNRERRKEVGKVFFDLSKYLLTTIAIGSLLAKEVNTLTTAYSGPCRPVNPEQADHLFRSIPTTESGVKPTIFWS